MEIPSADGKVISQGIVITKNKLIMTKFRGKVQVFLGLLILISIIFSIWLKKDVGSEFPPLTILYCAFA